MLMSLCYCRTCAPYTGRQRVQIHIISLLILVTLLPLYSCLSNLLAGIVTKLVDQLSPSDPLGSLVALQLLQELVITGGAAAQLLQQLLLPALLQLMDDPDTAAGAMPIAAKLVAAAADGQQGVVSSSTAAAAAANGNGVCEIMDVDGGVDAATALLARMQDVLDDRCVIVIIQ